MAKRKWDHGKAGPPKEPLPVDVHVIFCCGDIDLAYTEYPLDAPYTPVQLLDAVPKPIGYPYGETREWVQYFMKFDRSNSNIFVCDYPTESWTRPFLMRMAGMHRQLLKELREKRTCGGRK